MAIHAVGQNERLVKTVSGVPVIYSRITSAERAAVEKKHSTNRGIVDERGVMDTLFLKHIHGIQSDPNDPETFVYDDHGEKVENDAFHPRMVLKWPEECKGDLYEEMHKNSTGEDIREKGADRLGNLNGGSARITLREESPVKAAAPNG